MELYKCQSKVHKLEELLEQSGNAQNDELQNKLRQARAELKILKNMIEGRKAQASDTLQGSIYKIGQ